MICHRCSTDIQLSHVPGRLDTCSRCSAYLHCCLNCRFYDPSYSNACREPQADYVSDKAAGNYCEFFQPGPNVATGRRGTTPPKDARKAFDDLFKKN
jgi:hypothetical protein